MCCYIGSSGGRTRYGNVRHVYYSNSAAPHIRELFTSQADLIREAVETIAQEKSIQESVYTEHLQKRLEALLDFVDGSES
jgi:hypothetical protein